MPVKTPMYLKTTTPKKGKKLKLREVLSGDMISPPLGDVRHSAHVGPEGEGDMFGDVGFLQGKMDMLPSPSRPQNGAAGSFSEEQHVGDALTLLQEAHGHNGFNLQHSSHSSLKTTFSMPVFVAHEQAPPKPPRLHLDDTSAPPQHPSEASHRRSGGFSQQQPSLCKESGRLDSEPYRDVPTIRGIVPSSGSFSEVSSEDSMSESGGLLDVRRGLSLDSDAGLSNEDLRSERSDSPSCTAFHSTVLTVPPNVPRADSMARLDLDLGPSILEDVLSIMDRYKALDERYEL
uniref:CRIB domain-containing protein n=2 Tax=Nothobranchius TaxID=28779 RepID=A0A1A8L6S3_9TELE